MILTTVWMLAWAALIALPVWEFVFILDKEWVQAAITPWVWALLFWFTRWDRFRFDRKDFPNEQENV